MLFLSLSTQIILSHLIKMSVFITYAYFEWRMPLVSECINYGVLNAYLYN